MRVLSPATAAVAFVTIAAACHDQRISAPTESTPVEATVLRASVVPVPSTSDNYIRGVHYWAGWQSPDPDFGTLDSAIEAQWQEPWSPIQAFGSVHGSPARRMPALGYYAEQSSDVSDAQILAMVDAGFDYVIYQMAWSHDRWHQSGSGLFRGHAIANHMTSKHKHLLKFSVMWHDPARPQDWTQRAANGWTAATYRASVEALYTLWFGTYVGSASNPNPNFHTYGGRPVVFIFGPQDFIKAHDVFGGATTPVDMIALLRSVAAQHGYSGSNAPYVVAQAVEDWALPYLDDWGFDASTGYVYRVPEGPTPDSAGFENMIASFKNKWSEVLATSSVDFFVPNASGADGGPWNLDNHGAATPTQFERLVLASMDTASARVSRTGRNLVTCCWNEWGEGAYIEPSTMDYGYSYRGSSLADAHRRTVLGQQFGSNRTPFGWFDQITQQGYASGWALDPDTPNQPLHIHFYANSYWGDPDPVRAATREWVGGAMTLELREINTQYGVEGTHGFWFHIPQEYCGKEIYVHVLDSSGNDHNPVLGGSPITRPC